MDALRGKEAVVLFSSRQGYCLRQGFLFLPARKKGPKRGPARGGCFDSPSPCVPPPAPTKHKGPRPPIGCAPGVWTGGAGKRAEFGSGCAEIPAAQPSKPVSNSARSALYRGFSQQERTQHSLTGQFPLRKLPGEGGYPRGVPLGRFFSHLFLAAQEKMAPGGRPLQKETPAEGKKPCRNRKRRFSENGSSQGIPASGEKHAVLSSGGHKKAGLCPAFPVRGRNPPE